jgi:hypothetical protein
LRIFGECRREITAVLLEMTMRAMGGEEALRSISAKAPAFLQKPYSAQIKRVLERRAQSQAG